VATELVRYDAMCHAIAAAYEVDEVKDIRDRAIAIAAYARQIANIEAESRCAKIRVRAECRAAELYDAEQKAKGTRGQLSGRNPSGGVVAKSPEDNARTLAGYGITTKQMSDWRKLASIPKDQFEAAVESQHKPTGASILNAVFPSPKPAPVSNDAIWLWGRLEEFKREALGKEPSEFLDTMVDTMLLDVADLLPRVIEWLEQVRAQCQKVEAQDQKLMA
jgi:hypothetical protein